MKDLIRKLDFTSGIPNSYYNGSERYTNFLGGIYQIFMSICWIAGLEYFSKDIYLRENPSVIYSTEYDRIPYNRDYKNKEDMLIILSIIDAHTLGAIH